MITMTTIDLHGFNDMTLCSGTRLAQLSGLSPAELALLVEHGVILPVLPASAETASHGAAVGTDTGVSSEAATQAAAATGEGGFALLSFQMHTVVVAHAARRLRDDFELEGNGWLLAVQLWKRLQEAEAALRSVEARLSRFLG